MKKTHIFGVVVIAIAIGIIISTAGDASKYVTFDEAFDLASSGSDKKVHVIGELKKDASNQVVGVKYNPGLDPNFLAFTLVDENKEAKEIVCYQPPASMTDFEKSEKVVVIGRVIEDQFVASEILMKCPSKYEEREIQANSGKKVSEL
ncbi:cytochrome c maturation protein CcmE [Chondrinema litorale]|uniref:cytochrome c maturation protein CcmE domain-containing protein n=1 Tax=Chondrinema litorale TaxID=2994555 RepID=UPI002542CCC7|nr:cytochrome c maturation protein CcmE [Chondrinema litorale]UZR93246.1 cytochrome c maturation protein CcmE [Chondrinema litorale]